MPHSPRFSRIGWFPHSRSIIFSRAAQHEKKRDENTPCWSGPRWRSVAKASWILCSGAFPDLCVKPATPHTRPPFYANAGQFPGKRCRASKSLELVILRKSADITSTRSKRDPKRFTTDASESTYSGPLVGPSFAIASGPNYITDDVRPPLIPPLQALGRSRQDGNSVWLGC